MLKLTDKVTKFIALAEKARSHVGNARCQPAMDWLEPHEKERVGDVIKICPEGWIAWSVLYVEGMSQEVEEAMIGRVTSGMMAHHIAKKKPHLKDKLREKHARKMERAEKRQDREARRA